MRTLRLTKALLFLGLMTTVQADDRKFFPDDPVWLDDDRIATPVRPAILNLSEVYDRMHHTFGRPGGSTWGEAANVNTLDEVPNSTWFTNRHGLRRLSHAELKLGPNSDEGPDPRGVWTVATGKQGGLTPGFEVVDASGVRYVVKLDPVGLPELSSAAETIATKLFYAIGYNVPENHIVHVHPETLLVARDATFEDEFGRRRPLTAAVLRRMLSRIPRLPDGRIRVTASRYLEGEIIGPFRYYGTRSDDPNDIIPHEDRRELRGLRLFAAWMNHDDVRAHNTLDVWVADGDRHYVKHHLIDFGSTFGSGTVDLQLPNLGFHSWLDLGLVRKNAWSFGLHTPRYRKVRWPKFPEYDSVGRFESDAFEPDSWTPDYPNPAFVRMTDRDAFWAAKIIAAFTPDDLWAVVSTGQFSSAAQEQYFYDTLKARQEKILRHYFSVINPLDRFEVDGSHLKFTNLAEDFGMATSGTEYGARWLIYDNKVGTYTAGPTTATSTSVAVPIPDLPLQTEEYLVARIMLTHPGHPAWRVPVDVYLRPTGDGVNGDGGSFSIIGIERSPALAGTSPN